MNAISRKELLSALEQAVPRRILLDSDEAMHPFECDGLSVYRQLPLLAALPENTRQVREILRCCRRLGVPVVTRGAGTGLSGGALPLDQLVGDTAADRAAWYGELDGNHPIKRQCRASVPGWDATERTVSLALLERGDALVDRRRLLVRLGRAAPHHDEAVAAVGLLEVGDVVAVRVIQAGAARAVSGPPVAAEHGTAFVVYLNVQSAI